MEERHKMKFRAHETFFIRKGWLSKGMKAVENDGEVFISKEKNPMDTLGIGSNMVKSLRYWLQAAGLTSEAASGKRVQTLTEFGKIVFENDRYIEETGTLCLLHHNIATRKESATSWYVFFNDFFVNEFTEEDFLNHIQNYIKMHSPEGEKESGTARTLGDDFNCILGTYMKRENSEKENPENNISCPLEELHLVTLLDKKSGIYRKSIPSAKNFNPWIVLAIIQAQNKDFREELNLSALLKEPCSLGRTFNLDSITLIEILRSLEKIGEAKIIRTAGLDVLRLSHPEKTEIDYIRKYYESLNGRGGAL